MNDWINSSLQHMCIRRGYVLFTKLLLSLLNSIYIEYTTEFVFELATDTNDWNSNYMNECSINSKLNIHIWINRSTLINFFVSWLDNIFINMILKFSLHYPLILVFIFELKQLLWYHIYTIYTTFQCLILQGSLHDPLILVFKAKLHEWL
jgi:hypothetical protein